MLDVTTTGGPTLLVLSLFVGVSVSVLLASLIAYRAYLGYRRTRSSGLLAMSVGLLLVVVVPKLTNLALSTAQVQTDVVLTATASLRLFGLSVVLYSIYATD